MTHMLQIKNNTKRIVHSMILLSVVGIASSFTFVMVAVASGIAPDDVIALANGARSKAGLSALTENALLSQAAKNKANDMIKNDYFAHTSPKGVDPWYWMKQAGYQYQAAGENLAINYTDAKEQHSAWMKSATHRANILNTRYREIGVAVVKGKIDGKESIVTVEFFGTPLHAVADRVAAAPPIVIPAPAEIKGVEETVPSAVPVAENTPSVPSVPLGNFAEQKSDTATVATMTWLDISWLVFVALFGLSVILPVMVLFSRVYAALVTAPKTTTSAEMTEKSSGSSNTSQNSMLEHHLRVSGS